MMDLGHGYVGFSEYWEAHPHSMIVKIPVGGGQAQVVYEENYWLGHINASPKWPNILTFCHEGPWHKVENRIWGLNLEEGKFEGPRVLVWHRGAFHIQRVHPPPCFNASGTQIVYTADPQGYGQVFVVDVPAFEALPDLPPRPR